MSQTCKFHLPSEIVTLYGRPEISMADTLREWAPQFNRHYGHNLMVEVEERNYVRHSAIFIQILIQGPEAHFDAHDHYADLWPDLPKIMVEMRNNERRIVPIFAVWCHSLVRANCFDVESRRIWNSRRSSQLLTQWMVQQQRRDRAVYRPYYADPRTPRRSRSRRGSSMPRRQRNRNRSSSESSRSNQHRRVNQRDHSRSTSSDNDDSSRSSSSNSRRSNNRQQRQQLRRSHSRSSVSTVRHDQRPESSRSNRRFQDRRSSSIDSARTSVQERIPRRFGFNR